jgi:MFS family permease
VSFRFALVFGGMTVATIALGFVPGVGVLAVVLVAFGVASGYAGVPPAAMLSDVTPADASGTAIGAFRFCGDLGFLLGPAVAGYSTKALGFEEAFAIAAIPTLVALVAVARTPETLRRVPAGQPAG